METTRASGAGAMAAPSVLAQGLLFVYMNPPAGDEQAFNAWYDEEHAPNRLTVPGIFNGRRYEAATDEGPRYMAMYDLESPATLERPEYVRLATERSEREKAMLAKVPMVDRRILKNVLNAPAWTENAPYVLAVGMDPAAGGEDDFVAWYRDEHIPLLLKVPGWRRARLYEQVDGNGTRYLALHELESPAVFETKEYHAATHSPWRDRVIGGVTRRERNLLKFRRDFPRPAWGAP